MTGVGIDEKLGAFVISSFDAAQEILHGQGWVSDLSDNIELISELGGTDQLPPLMRSMLRLFMDGPAHDKFRKLVAPSFTARRIEQFRDRIGAVVEAALDGVEGRGEFDVVTELGYPIPVSVIAELLDVGVEGAQLINIEAPRLAQLLEFNPGEDLLLDAAEATMNCVHFLLPLLAERSAEPGEDFISAMLTAESDGERLDLEEVLAIVLTLLVAGLLTTANLISNGVLNLLRNPGQAAILRDKPELIKECVEEVLRIEPPVAYTGRTAVTAHRVGGLAVEPGQQVIVHLVGANRDPARFAEPDTFDLLREDSAQVAFGGGAHFCLGAALARIETEEVLSRLIARFPDLALAEPEVRWRASTAFHALEGLAVRV
ncbi:cytochrome P450 [Amycolatopsis sp. NPDC059657]|uniref:cytochrome P450 n=1 Tax=Amycolatopsis sp. NPDC059657 TaxID=3346899 RepID=UPI00366B07FD